MESLLRLTLVPSRSPAFWPQPSPISNRYNKLLETPVTHTKQTTAPRSNRYKNRFLFSCCSARRSTPRVAIPACPPRRPSSLQLPASVSNRPYFPILFSPRASGFRNVRSASGSSNRYNKLLECLVSRTKQTIAPRSNRYKFALISRTADSRDRLLIRACLRRQASRIQPPELDLT